MNTKQETYADKISKLLRKAESTTPEEAEALFSKAQELMVKYAIDEAMIAAVGGVSKDRGSIVAEEFVMIGIYRFPLGRLTWYVLLNNGIQAIQMGGKNWREIDGRVYKETYILKAVGFKQDLDRVRVLQTSLMLQAVTAENLWWKKHSHLYSKKEAHFARRGFLFAFAEGVHEKLAEAAARGRAQADEEHGSDSVALVLRDKNQLVKDEFTRMFPNTRSVSDRKNAGDAFARSHGREAGRRADVGQPGMPGSRKGIAR